MITKASHLLLLLFFIFEIDARDKENTHSGGLTSTLSSVISTTNYVDNSTKQTNSNCTKALIDNFEKWKVI